MVLGYMAPLDVLSVKFVSRAAYLRTKYPDGQEIVDLRAGVNSLPTSLRHRAHSKFMVKLEAEDLQCRSLLRLTCDNCGAQKANDCHGFEDSEFDQDDLMRWCIQCTCEGNLLDTTSKVRGEDMFFCELGASIMPIEQKVRPSEMDLMARSIRIFMNDPQNKNKFASAEMRILRNEREEPGICVHCLRNCMKRLRKWPSLNSGSYSDSLEAFKNHQETLVKSLLRCSDL